MVFTAAMRAVMGGSVPGPKTVAGIYCSNGGSEIFTTVDISDPTAMAVLDSVSITGVSTYEQIGYDPVTQHVWLGLTSVDVSNPSALSVTTDSIERLAITDAARQLLFTLQGSDIRTMDISNTSSASQVDSLTMPFTVVNFAYDETAQVLYVGSYGASLANPRIYAVDASDETALAILDWVELSGGGGGPSSGPCTAFLSTDRQTVFACYNGYVEPIDVSDPANLALGTRTAITSMGTPKTGAVTDDHLLLPLGSGTDIVVSLDITDPDAITEDDRYTSATNINGAIGAAYDPFSKYLYVLGHSGDEISSFDMSDISTLSFSDNLTDATNLNEPYGIVLF